MYIQYIAGLQGTWKLTTQSSKVKYPCLDLDMSRASHLLYSGGGGDRDEIRNGGGDRDDISNGGGGDRNDISKWWG